MQTFEQFKSTRKWTDDIGRDLGIAEMEHNDGYIYTIEFDNGEESRFYIEDAGFECGQYYCMCYNAEECSDDLETVEKFLFENC